MKVKLLILVMTLLSCALYSQTHRVRFKYRISQEKINDLTARGIILKDANNNVVNLCNTSILKCLITNSNGNLIIDPWTITDARINSNSTETDPCYNSPGIVNANTVYPLKIDITRGFSRAAGTPVVVGHPTESVSFHYQTWLIGVNTFGVKFRPGVEDYNGNKYSSNAITGTINAGLTIAYSFGWTTFTHRSATSWSFSPAFSLGMASASLSKEPLKKQEITTYNPSNFILSPSVGVILGRNDIGIFFAYGHDFMTGEHSSSWAYQGKRFMGIGLSASFKL